MSLLLHTKAERELICDMLFTLIQKLSFHAVSAEEQRQTAQHFFNLRGLGSSLDVSLRLYGDIASGRTRIEISIKPEIIQ